MNQETQKSPIRLNLGCGGRPLMDYINVDLSSLEELKKRYPTQHFPEGIKIFHYDIFNLPYPENSVDEIRCDALIEHLTFMEESLFFNEVKRVLRPGGLLRFAVPDFEEVIKMWLEAKDEWKDFFRNDDEAIKKMHWFGQNSYSTDNKWGYLTAVIFGSQNGDGQFHKNCYTAPKIHAIMQHLKFDVLEISRERWKGDREFVLFVRAAKKKAD